MKRLDNMGDLKKAKQVLKTCHKPLKDHLQKTLQTRDFNYVSFGTEIQPYISAFLADHFKKQGLINYAIAKDKNQFPDFTLKTSPELAIEYKCGNVVELKDKKWIKCKNSENDMGTLNMWEKKLKQFGGDNIYYLFVIYHFDDTIKKIVEVQIDLFYKFLALNKDGALRYREKDGNLRPKDFYADSPITTLEQFEDLRSGTDVYRSRRIIKKHIKHIPKKDRKKFLKELS